MSSGRFPPPGIPAASGCHGHSCPGPLGQLIALQVVDQGQHVTGIAPQLVQHPHHDFISVPEVIEQLVQRGPTGPRPTHAMVGEDPATTRST